MKYEFGEVAIRKRNRLPHWDPEAGVQFSTFNLFDAIPAVARQRIEQEEATQLEVIQRTRKSATIADRIAVDAWKRRQLQGVLDQSNGCCLLRDPALATIVEDSIRYLDGRKYGLISWTVMPNHAHLVYSVRDSTIDDVMQTLKGFTAHAINKRLGRSGALWQRDYFDRLLRTSDELERVVRYVLRNASPAGLEGWPHQGVVPENLAAAL